MLNNILKHLKRLSLGVSATSLLTAGALTAEIGGKLFAVRELFRYFEIDSPIALVVCEAAAIATSSYTFIFSRGLANWKFFSELGEKHEGETGLVVDFKNGLKEVGIIGKLMAGEVALVSIPTGLISFALMSYCGSDAFFKYCGLQNRLALVAINSYIGISSSITACYFASRGGVKNLFCTLGLIKWIPKKPSAVKISITPLAFALPIGILRTISQVAVVNFMAKQALDSLVGSEMPDNLRALIAGTAVMLSVPVISQNRTVELYHWFSGFHLPCRQTGIEQKKEKQKCQLAEKVLIGTHGIFGTGYVCFFAILSYVSMADLESQCNLDSKLWYSIGLNLVNSACNTIVEYAFTNKAMYSQCKSMFFSCRSQAQQRPPLLSPSINQPLLGEEANSALLYPSLGGVPV